MVAFLKAHGSVCIRVGENIFIYRVDMTENTSLFFPKLNGRTHKWSLVCFRGPFCIYPAEEWSTHKQKKYKLHT